VLMLGVIGIEVGSRWEEWRDRLHYLDYAVIAGILALIAYVLIMRRRGGSGRVADQDTGPEADRPGEVEPATRL
jgi:hypothetical protein